jgi:DNA-binding MarR family transcriptional regulator
LSNDFEKESRPFFGFFTNYYLKNLTFPERLEFLIEISVLDNRADVTDFLKQKGRPQIKALYELVKGNHRLLVTFYEFLKTDTLARLSTHFIKTINDLKPYYESFIRYLPPQQQKILRYIALSRKPQNGVDICKNCFIEQRTFSKQISELTRKGLIEAITDPTDKRNKLYDINEPLLRISIEVGEHREGITALFVDFLANFYSREELLERKSKFISQQQSCANEPEARQLYDESNDLDIAIIEKDIDILMQRFDKINDGYDLNPRERILSQINDSIIQILKISHSNKQVNFERLKAIAIQYQLQFPVFKITEKYIEIFQKYVVEGDKKAIYSLPKEQREFIRKEILGEGKEEI